MSYKSWGAFKGTYNGHGIYWSGTYNVEGYGEFRTKAEAHAYVDSLNAARRQKERDEANARIEAGAIRCTRDGDNVTVHLPTGTVTVPIRVYRQSWDKWEAQFGKECVWA